MAKYLDVTKLASWISVLQTIGQWILIAGVLIGVWASMERRIAIMEKGNEQEQAGYNIALSSMRGSIESIDRKLEILISKAHSHKGGN